MQYQRRLPHWDPGDAALFITWRLRGSLPTPPSDWEVLPAGRRFVALDRSLDHSPVGPHWLKNPAVAECVSKALRYGSETLQLYDLDAWVIMSNHIHILIDPRAPLPRITRAIKSYSAKEANLILGRTGEPLWQIESFDHWVRSEKEFANIVQYIEFNPVKAGLVTRPEDWRWSSAWKEAGREACATKA
jgi:REP element-mobilizing transposase RayT